MTSQPSLLSRVSADRRIVRESSMTMTFNPEMLPVFSILAVTDPRSTVDPPVRHCKLLRRHGLFTCRRRHLSSKQRQTARMVCWFPVPTWPGKPPSHDPGRRRPDGSHRLPYARQGHPACPPAAVPAPPPPPLLPAARRPGPSRPADPRPHGAPPASPPPCAPAQ